MPKMPVSSMSLRDNLKTASWLMLLAAASIFSINQYRYGIDDHATVLAFLKASVNPALYPHDIFLEQKRFFYTMLWAWLGQLHRFTGWGLPAIFFLTYCGVVLAFFAGVFRLTKVLFENSKIVPYFATFLFIFFTQSVAGLGLVENILINRMAVFPIILFSFAFFAENRLELALALQGFAFYLQPINAMNALAVSTLVWILHYRVGGLKRLLKALVIAGIIASPMLLWRLTSHPEMNMLSRADPSWMELMRLRLSYHALPLSWDRTTLIRLFFLFFLVLKLRMFYASPTEAQKKIFTACWVILFLFVFYTFFTEIVPVPAVFIFRWIRSYTYFTAFAIIFFSDRLLRATLFEKSGWGLILWTLASLGFFFGTRKGWEIDYAIFVFVILGLGFLRRFVHEEKIRQALLPVTAVTLIFISGLTYAARIMSGQKHFTIQSAQNPDWLDAQKWAREHTALQDIFIAPPNLPGFRVDSERSIYGSWKDGALATYAPVYGKVWLERMKALAVVMDGGNPPKDHFQDLKEPAFRKMADEIRSEEVKVYLVSFGETNLSFPLRYENRSYKIYEIPA